MFLVDFMFSLLGMATFFVSLNGEFYPFLRGHSGHHGFCHTKIPFDALQLWFPGHHGTRPLAENFDVFFFLGRKSHWRLKGIAVFLHGDAPMVVLFSWGRMLTKQTKWCKNTDWKRDWLIEWKRDEGGIDMRCFFWAFGRSCYWYYYYYPPPN